MEEQQIQGFVAQAMTNKDVRSELALDPRGVIGREGYSPRVVDILLRLVPCLLREQPLDSDEKWWHA